MANNSSKILKDYESWSAYREALASVDPTADVGHKDRGWCGSLDVGEALSIADRGWPEGMERVHAISLPAVAAVAGSHVEETQWQWDVTGANYDVGEYLSGAPECWLAPVESVSKPCLTIAVNLCSSGGIPAEMIERRGAGVVALALLLQSKGYAVKVYAIEGVRPSEGYSRANGVDVWCRTLLTDSNGGPIDADRLVFAVAHSASTRQLGYSLACKLAGKPAGSCALLWPANDHACQPPSEFMAGVDVYLPPPFLSDANWNSAESVSEWVSREYDRLTGNA